MTTRSINEITLEELMGEDFSVFISKNPSFGFNLYLEDDFYNEITTEGINQEAMDNFYTFCKNFIKQFDKFKR